MGSLYCWPGQVPGFLQIFHLGRNWQLTQDLNSYRMGAHKYYGPGPDFEAMRQMFVLQLPSEYKPCNTVYVYIDIQIHAES
jgi:hypothetical protein